MTQTAMLTPIQTLKDVFIIRTLTLDDAPLLMQHARAYWQDTGYRIFQTQCDPVYATEWVYQQCVAKPSLVLLAFHEDELAGWIGGSIVPFPMLPDVPYLWEWLWWIRPPYRDGPLAMRLWRHMRRWAKANGARVLMYGRPEAVSSHEFIETVHWRLLPEKE